jgi:hypothetical protein
MRLPRGHLLLHTDQGYGDAFQFARHIPEAIARVARVTLHCETPCVPLLSRIAGLACVTDDWQAVGDASVQTTLASLPGLFGITPKTIPASPYLSADQQAIDLWRERLDQRLPKGTTRIGLSWAGNPKNINDVRRSVPFGSLARLTSLEGASFICLQRDKRRGDDDAMRAIPGLLDLGAEITDFAETAAVMANLDLVISVCSSVTHLAGALGRPVWVMLCHAADWRWHIARDDSPWYPSARLFRQRRAGAWDGVVDEIEAALPEFIGRAMQASAMLPSGTR